MRRRLIAQCRDSSNLLPPRPIASLVIAPEDRPDVIVRCSPPGSGYSPTCNNSEHADLVSFIELLHVPTVGRSALAPQDLDLSHLRMVNTAILHGNAKHIFVSTVVARLMRSSRAFPWLPKEPSGPGPLRLFYSEPSRSVYLHLHFSNYGKFQQQLEAEAHAIAGLLIIGA